MTATPTIGRAAIRQWKQKVADDNPYIAPTTTAVTENGGASLETTAPNTPDYKRWAITLAVLPVVVMLCYVFVLERYFDISYMLGNRLGLLFLFYLISLAIAAVIHKVKSERRSHTTTPTANND